MKMMIPELEKKARTLRLNIIKMVGVGQKGHLGGSCSLAEIVAVLYFYKMKHDPKNPQWEDRDRFLLSKGHAALIQYAALAEWGYFPKEEIEKVKCLGAMLQGHPDMQTTP
ncbi:MAG: transketolase, partial [Candidatus Hodarchaeota archaeon]